MQRLEQRQNLHAFTWRLESGRQVSFDAIAMFDAYMDLCQRIYAAWAEEELEPPTGALAALLETAPEEHARMAERLSWLNSFDAMVEAWQNPTPEGVSFALQGDNDGGDDEGVVLRFP